MLPFVDLFGYRLFLYPLFMGLAWGIGYHWTWAIISESAQNFPHFRKFSFGLFLFSWIGAKAFYIASVDSHFWSFSSFWMGGGFVFYGGLIFAVFYILLFFKLLNISWRSVNLLVPGMLLGHSVGRMGCFLAGCCHGHLLSLDSWLRPRLLHFPIQLIEALALLIMGIYFTRNFARFRDSLWWRYLLFYSALRFTIEFARGDELRGFGPFATLSTSQWISLFVIIAALFVLKFAKR